MSEATSSTVEADRISRPASVKVWDLFVRVFHWLLVILFAAAWWSGGIWDAPHLAAGYAVSALIAARVVWGFLGSRHARFSDFLRRPSMILCYIGDMLRMRAPRYIGHNPAGGAMVITLLATLAVICVSGVMMTTDAFWGVKWVDNLHAAASTIALVFVGLHIGGVIFAGVEHGENLVRSMITGLKRAT
jgi:cytochrome b